MNNQLSIFDVTADCTTDNRQSKRTKQLLTSKIKDVRSNGQLNRAIAFDVGEKIGGARKDLARQREEFLTKPSLDLLAEIEHTDVTIAAEVIVRDTFFNWFTLEDCKDRGVDPGAAKAIQLFINRIPKESKDSAEDRRKYVASMLLISSLLRTVKTKDEYYSFEKYIMYTFTSYLSQQTINEIEEKINELQDKLSDEVAAQRQKLLARLFVSDLSKCLINLRECSGPFRNYFYKPQSRVSLLRNAFSFESWDELLPTKEEQLKKTKPTRKQPVWERVLPDKPVRSAGSPIVIENPKHYVEHFGFRASEFGHYVSDDKGREHLLSSAEAFTDLAELLELPTKAVSLNGELAMAFGSRGRGRALGHYEPLRKVINLTKDKGSLGILAHEWFHSLDHYLYNKSFDFKNGKPGYLTNNNFGEHISNEVGSAVSDLMESIKIGESTAYVDVRDCKKSYRVSQRFIDRYERVGGDLFMFMDFGLIDFDAIAERQLSYFSHEESRKKAEAKYARQRSRKIRQDAEALAEYHFKRTGEKVDNVPYPVLRSAFFQHAIGMDQGAIGKYWSSDVELAARAFEFYIYQKLQDKDWISDYLVCGIRDDVFPREVAECNRIYRAMDQFMKAVNPILSEL